ncbi:AAC(3) family N-acetyltransferase [Jeotgalibaca sp. MA1X17-3]|uniref:AAC(3) family N-acetyltransferase n=1 Tax=Jeotgalibaca sp. MA1X17-3 TaxID=2908211 RepID=UPI001F3A8772|nr:AAC(3) family N-acetyltransferase [Jeotgalibaca sp. MA1X17-3]UJF15918.1 AAC(3) family N-acetyltransferase [Jeotgalibaca sp. MA1X17-3]
MYTKDDLKKQLKNLEINPKGTIFIHSSFKSMGEIPGGPDIVLDAFSEYMKEGLLVLPSHTWSQVNETVPFFNVDQMPTNVGILTELFRQRKHVIRSLHPTHSVAALGEDAKEFTSGEEKMDTPCSRKSVYGKLLDREAKILLIGVDLKRNTFIHGIEEWLDIPNRMTDSYELLYTVLSDGTTLPVPSRRHTESWSQFYSKADDLLLETNAMYIGKLGDAEVRICDTKRMTEVLTVLLKIDSAIFSDDKPLSGKVKMQVLKDLNQ